MIHSLPPMIDGANLLSDRNSRVGPDVLLRIGTAQVELVSAVLWQTTADWSIPRRTCPDTLLFVSLDGNCEIQLGSRWWPVSPGNLVIVPGRQLHAARYRNSCRSWRVLAFHVLMRDTYGLDVWAGFAAPIHPVMGWIPSLLDLTGAVNRGHHAGEPLLSALAVSLVAHGAEYRFPAVSDQRIASAMERFASEPGVSIEAVAQGVGLQPARFRQRFNEIVGMAPKAWEQQQRLGRAARLLRQTLDSVQAIAAEVGYASDHQFHRAFRRAYGMTPSAWRLGSPVL